MSRNGKILIITIIILLGIASLGTYYNRNNIIQNKELNKQAEILTLENGEELKTLNMLEIQKLGEVNFKATLDTSNSDPQEYLYTGVPLKNIFLEAGINFDKKEIAVVTGADSYTVGISIDKILENDNVYIAYKKDGYALGSRENGGSGPYQLIIRKDQFSQNWCKYVVKVELR